MDQTISAARITNDPISRGYRTYYGESEVKEIDMSGAFGYEETKDMDGCETYKYFVKELGMEKDEAKDRVSQQGKDWTCKKDEKSEYSDDPNFITRATLSEIQKQKAIKVVEDMLAKKKDSGSADVGKKETESLSPVLKKNLQSLIKQAEKHGFSKKDLIKIIQGE
jgi:DNA-binding transcriptional regulator YhcF (GntR family)